jgi:hypothetical protein
LHRHFESIRVALPVSSSSLHLILYIPFRALFRIPVVLDTKSRLVRRTSAQYVAATCRYVVWTLTACGVEFGYRVYFDKSGRERAGAVFSQGYPEVVRVPDPAKGLR